MPNILWTLLYVIQQQDILLQLSKQMVVCAFSLRIFYGLFIFFFTRKWDSKLNICTWCEINYNYYNGLCVEQWRLIMFNYKASVGYCGIMGRSLLSPRSDSDMENIFSNNLAPGGTYVRRTLTN
jgi:hypothetical protein